MPRPVPRRGTTRLGPGTEPREERARSLSAWLAESPTGIAPSPRVDFH